MDKKLIRERFGKAAGTYLQKADIQLKVARKMAVLTEKTVPSECFERILEIGCGTGGFTKELMACSKAGNISSLYLNDICPGMKDFIPERAYHCAREVHFIAEDAERMVLPYDLGLIASCSAIQWFDSIKDFLGKSFHALRPGGYLAISTFGPENLMEIKRITGKGLSYIDIEELNDIITGCGFKILYSDREILRMNFESPLEVLKHLRDTGVTGLTREKWTKGNLMDFTRKYHEINKEIALTYNPIYLIAQKP